MTGPRRNAKGSRRPGQAAEPKPADFWRAAPDPAPPGEITPAADPTALLRSLGPPPLLDQAGADRFAVVVARASALATALAAAAGILASSDEA